MQYAGQFGSSVLIDGKLAFVGAPEETADGAGGNVYVYNTATWEVIKNLTSPNPQLGVSFGSSIAISGKLLVVGAPFESAGGYTTAGHAYVYDVATWKLIQNLTSPNAQKNGLFGSAVAISGKLAVVGAPGETADGVYASGAAYVYNAATGELIQNLTSPNAQEGGGFASSVAVSGGLALVGAPGETAEGAGDAYVYNTATWKVTETLTSPNAQEGGEFGDSVAISSKLALIGAPDEDADGWYEAGNAYAFNAATGELVKNLTSPHATEGGSFGFSVAISGNVAAISAPWESPPGHGLAGDAYVYNTATWKVTETLTSPHAQAYSKFGYSVAVNNKLAIVGAPWETADGYDYAGQAYVFKVR